MCLFCIITGHCSSPRNTTHMFPTTETRWGHTAPQQPTPPAPDTHGQPCRPFPLKTPSAQCHTLSCNSSTHRVDLLQSCAPLGHDRDGEHWGWHRICLERLGRLSVHLGTHTHMYVQDTHAARHRSVIVLETCMPAGRCCKLKLPAFVSVCRAEGYRSQQLLL